jgi:hypothetical protein
MLDPEAIATGIEKLRGVRAKNKSLLALYIFSSFSGVETMFLSTSKSRKSSALLSAGVAAILASGCGLSLANASVTTLTWDPAASSTSGTNGSGNWNSTGSYWYNGTTNQAWTNGDAAYFGTGTGGSGNYTVTVGSSGYSPASLTSTNSGNTYVLTGGAISTSGALIANGNLTLQSITLTDTNTNNTNSAGSGSTAMSQASGATLVVGNGANLDTSYIGAGVSDTGTIDVNSGGYLGGAGGSGRIQINFGPNATGSAFNVNGGTVSLTGTSAEVWLSDAPNPTTSVGGAFTVGAGGTGGTVNVTGFNTAGTGTGTGNQTGTLNVDSGTVKTQFISANSAGATTILNVNGGTVTSTNTASITSNSGATTIVNLNGGILSVHAITESGSTTAATGTTTVNFNGGTLQENNASVGIVANAGGSNSLYTPKDLNVLAGGAVVDTNGYSPVIYNPLLTGTAAGTTDGGLTVENSNPTKGGVSINGTTGALTITGGQLTITGANTYTGATVVNSDAALQLEDHTASNPNGGVTGVATIAKTSMLQIDSGAALILNPDGVGTQISVGGLNLQGGILSFGFDGASVQNLLVGTAAAVSGTNIINMADISGGKTAVPAGTYTLIADAAGGLTGTFEFGNGSTTGTLVVGTNTYTGTLNDSSTAVTLTVSAVPEPAPLALLALGGLALLAASRRRRFTA